MFVVRQGRKDDINKEGCCEKWWNVTVRVVGAVLDSGAQHRGWWWWGALSQLLQGNWLQMWGSVAPAPARRQGRIKSSAQGWWDSTDKLTPAPRPRNTDWTSYCAADRWSSTSSPPTSQPCTSSAKTTEHRNKTLLTKELLHFWPWFRHWQYKNLSTDYYVLVAVVTAILESSLFCVIVFLFLCWPWFWTERWWVCPAVLPLTGCVRSVYSGQQHICWLRFQYFWWKTALCGPWAS